MKVNFFKHNLGKEENESIKIVMESTFLSTGPVTKRFEEKFADYLGINYCVGVCLLAISS